MLSRIQRSAASWSRSAQVVVETVAEVAELESAENTDPVGDVDHHHVAVRRQPRPVVELKLTRAEHECPAGNPHHHRQRGGGVRRPHRQVRHASSRTLGSSRPPPTNDLLCGGSGPCSTGIADPVPRLQGRGRQKPAFADGLLGVGDPAPDADAALCRAAQIARIRVHDGGMFGNNCHARIVVCEAGQAHDLQRGYADRHQHHVEQRRWPRPRPRNGDRRRIRRTAHRGGRAVPRRRSQHA